MSNTTQVATMATVQEKVKERIQASFMDLVPPELWEGMVQAELHRFQTDTLPKLVKEEAEKRLRALLASEFAKPEWADKWGSSGSVAGPLLADVLRQAAPELVAALFSQVSMNVVQHIRNNRY